jgi:putative transposase
VYGGGSVLCDKEKPMPRRKKTEEGALPDELIDQLLKGSSPDQLTGPNGLIKQLVAKLVTRAMSAELDHHLGYEAGQTPPEDQSNRRNGTSPKTLRSDLGPIPIEVPRDRDGSFEPQIVGKHERHFNGFDDKILSMYARGMSVRDIQGHLQEIYGVDVSPDLISTVTDAVVEEMRAWQSRPLEQVYLVVYIDALMTKIRDKGVVQNKAIYTVLGVAADGEKDVLGFWTQPAEGAKFWLNIFGELRQRGVQDILIVCADGLTGIGDAIEAAFPHAIHQTCIVHLIRSSTRLVPWKDRKAVCADLKAVYTATDAVDAEAALDAFEAKWGKRFPMVAPAWRRRWAEVVPFLAFPPELRKAIYTTNAVESFNSQLRKVLKTRGHMPNDEAALKLLFLATRHATKRWKPKREWILALMQFAIFFEGRFNP